MIPLAWLIGEATDLAAEHTGPGIGGFLNATFGNAPELIIALIAGVGMGLAYGWLIDPVDFFDLTPDTLRADYKTDYVLMTAEAYRTEQDPGLAARRLAIFGLQSPSAIATQGLDYARTNAAVRQVLSLPVARRMPKPLARGTKRGALPKALSSRLRS